MVLKIYVIKKMIIIKTKHVVLISSAVFNNVTCSKTTRLSTHEIGEPIKFQLRPTSTRATSVAPARISENEKEALGTRLLYSNIYNKQHEAEFDKKKIPREVQINVLKLALCLSFGRQFFFLLK